MQVERFGHFKTGLLVPIRINERLSDFAFAPNPLPPAWEPSGRVWPLIAEARDRVASLDGAGGILPNPSLLLRPLQRREAIKSNSIEGTYVSPEELLQFEAEKNQNKDPLDERRNDWREVLFYDRALNEGCERIERGDPIDRRLICDLHAILLRSSRGRDKTPGEFRGRQVYVEASRRFIPSPPELLEEQVADLESYFHSNHGDPLVRAFIAHYQFEAIHPFQDGNGRIGRLILSLCVYKWLRHSHAWLYLSEFFDKHRTEYINKLFSVSTDGDWEEWVEFCLLGTIEHAEASVDRCKKLNDLKRMYEVEIGTASPRMGRILNLLLSNPFTDTTRLSQELNVSFHTAQADIKKLCTAGVLEALKTTGRRQSYCAQEIFSVAYGD